ncbi:hypothetical protein FRC08_005518 [Ceratobasidium sp. 394]|nr:hypothetical protein FRC08_005518 [Ceratobasidium sp. 394]
MATRVESIPHCRRIPHPARAPDTGGHTEAAEEIKCRIRVLARKHHTQNPEEKKCKSQFKNLAAPAHETASTDHAHDTNDIRAGKVDPALLANPVPASSAPSAGGNTEAEDVEVAGQAKSVVVETIAKRYKALVKKARRVNEYESEEKLNGHHSRRDRQRVGEHREDG